jgi:hypothetical protein
VCFFKNSFFGIHHSLLPLLLCLHNITHLGVGVKKP